jgi:hypothetical protein
MSPLALTRDMVLAQPTPVSTDQTDILSSKNADGQEGEASDDDNDDKTEPKFPTPDDSNVFTMRYRHQPI